MRVESVARGMLLVLSASAAAIPRPPPFVMISVFLPCGMMLRTGVLKRVSKSNAWLIVSAWIALICLKMPVYTRALPASDAVWLWAASAPASVSPPFSMMSGFLHCFAAFMNARPSCIPSMYASIVCVSLCAASSLSRSVSLMSSAFP